MRARFSLQSILAAWTLGLALLFAGPLLAQQPTSVNPTASSVKEDQLLDALKGDKAEINGRISIPDQKAATLIRPAGRDWRDFHRGTLPWIGAIAILGMLAILALFFFIRGRIRITAGPSGLVITRFGSFERFIHWMTASCFIVLALSGLNVSFGRTLLLPLIGPSLFSPLSEAAKFAHNYLAFPFMVGVALMFLTWVKDNLPSRADGVWLSQLGGLFNDSHPPAARFNAGQKLIFWSVVVGGALLSISGFHLLFPNMVEGGVLDIQFHNKLHGVVAIGMVAIMLAHIYIGSLGMEGAFDAMGSGEVDLNWAKEHHGLWVQDELAKGVRPTPTTMVPAE